MQIIKLWACLTNTDSVEGRGREIPVAYTKSKEKAAEIISDPMFYSRYGVMGCNNCCIREETFVIIDSVLEIPTLDKEKIRCAALAKLTDVEKEILGL